ncbi:MAG: NADH-quinone oxidoreductase subunit J [Actinomycetota bacterium]
MVELVLFILFGLVALFGAVTMVWARNPVYSAMGLMLTMFSIAVFYVSNAAHFIAAVQVIIYAGAVMTLFLFVVMLIGVDNEESRKENIPLQRPAALAVIALFGVGVILAGRSAWVTGSRVSGLGEIDGSVERVGSELFNNWLLPFEVTALLLIVAATGAIALAFFRDDEETGT